MIRSASQDMPPPVLHPTRAFAMSVLLQVLTQHTILGAGSGSTPLEIPLRTATSRASLRALTPILSVTETQAVPPEVVKYEFDVKSNGTVASVPTAYLESLHPQNWAYFLTVQFAGNQEMSVVIDTGSMGLSVPVEPVRAWPANQYPLLDRAKAGLQDVACSDARCAADCRPQDIESVFSCGPHGGSCVNTSGPAACAFVFEYADNSFITGLVLTGTLGIAGKQVKSTIGGIIGSTEFFYEGWRGNGILGLARADCRALRFPYSCFYSPVDDLIEQHSLPNIISLCFNNRDGVLTVGGGNSGQYTGELTYTPWVEPHDKFFVMVSSLQLDGRAIVGAGKHRHLRPDTPPGTGVVGLIDTGVPGLWLSERLYAQFVQAARTALQDQPRLTEGPHSIFDGYAKYIAPEVLARLPVLTITLDGGMTFTVPPQQYFVEVWALNVSYVPLHSLLIQKTTDKSDLQEVSIGQPVLHRLYIEVDRAGKRFGFAPSKENCRST